MLTRIKEAELHLMKVKCGLFKSDDEQKAITGTSRSQNVTQLQRFIGVVIYCDRCVSKLSIVIHSVYNLLKQNERSILNKF